MRRSRRPSRALAPLVLSVVSLLVVVLTAVATHGGAAGPSPGGGLSHRLATLSSAGTSSAVAGTSSAVAGTSSAVAVASAVPARSALTARTRGTVARDGRTGWKQVARDDRGPARAGQRQRGGEPSPLVVTLLLLLLLGRRPGRADLTGAPRRPGAGRTAGGFLRRAPPLRTV